MAWRKTRPNSPITISNSAPVETVASIPAPLLGLPPCRGRISLPSISGNVIERMPQPEKYANKVGLEADRLAQKMNDRHPRQFRQLRIAFRA